jgi:hypothetical protein
LLEVEYTKVTVERKYERDIDMLLAEEFIVNSTFANWFAAKTKFQGSMLSVANVFVSKSNNMGESDLIVILERGERDDKVAILIEDKIDAPLQPTQAERYRLRADQAIQSGEWTDYEVVLCAPQSYFVSRAEVSSFDRLIAFEDIAAFLAKDESPRARYRSDFLATAATRRKNSWIREQDDATDAFWNAAYEVATRDFPILELKRPKMTKGSNNFVLRPHWIPTQPKNNYIWIKGNLGFVDLTFGNTVAYQFAEQIAQLLPSGMTVHQTRASAAVRMEALPFAVSEGIEIGLPKVRRAFEACEKLARFYRANQSVIADAANRSTPLK